MFTFVLSCNHIGTYLVSPPRLGDEVSCMTCWRLGRDANVTVDRPMDSWRVRCETCHYSRDTGADRSGAIRLASKHYARFPSHDVQYGIRGKAKSYRRIGTPVTQDPLLF